MQKTLGELAIFPVPLLALSLLICQCSKLYQNLKEKGTSLKVPAHMLKDLHRHSSFGITSCFMFSVKRCGHEFLGRAGEQRGGPSGYPSWLEGVAGACQAVALPAWRVSSSSPGFQSPEDPLAAGGSACPVVV